MYIWSLKEDYVYRDDKSHLCYNDDHKSQTDMDNSKQSPVTPAQSKKVAVALGMAVMVFLLGTLFGTTLSKEPQTKEIEVEKNVSIWRELKEIDDQTFVVAVKSSELSSAAFYAISQGDNGTIQAVTAEAKKNSQEFEKLKIQRKEVLEKLGY